MSNYHQECVVEATIILLWLKYTVDVVLFSDTFRRLMVLRRWASLACWSRPTWFCCPSLTGSSSWPTSARSAHTSPTRSWACCRSSATAARRATASPSPARRHPTSTLPPSAWPDWTREWTWRKEEAARWSSRPRGPNDCLKVSASISTLFIINPCPISWLSFIAVIFYVQSNSLKTPVHIPKYPTVLITARQIMKWSWRESSQTNRREKRTEETLVRLQGTQECEAAQFELTRQEGRINKSLNQVYTATIKILPVSQASQTSRVKYVMLNFYGTMRR